MWLFEQRPARHRPGGHGRQEPPRDLPAEEFDELTELLLPRGEQVFFGAYAPRRLCAHAAESAAASFAPARGLAAATPGSSAPAAADERGQWCMSAAASEPPRLRPAGSRGRRLVRGGHVGGDRPDPGVVGDQSGRAALEGLRGQLDQDVPPVAGVGAAPDPPASSSRSTSMVIAPEVSDSRSPSWRWVSGPSASRCSSASRSVALMPASLASAARMRSRSRPNRCRLAGHQVRFRSRH